MTASRKRSAGILLYRRRADGPEFLLVHPGGPYWAKKDLGAWSIPKGEMDEGETDELAVAIREMHEETGLVVEPPFTPLPAVRQSGGKLVVAFLVEGDCDPATLRSNEFTMEWPPRSGTMQSFPEVDRAAFFDGVQARRRILRGQVPLIDAAEKHLAAARSHGSTSMAAREDARGAISGVVSRPDGSMG